MKGFLLVVVLTISSFFVSHSQIRFGILGGGQTAKILEENDLPDFAEYSKGYSSRTGVHFGFIADVPFSPKVSFQLSIMIQTKGRKHYFSHDSTVVFERPNLPDSIVETTYEERQRQFINYIDIPLNIVYKLPLGKKAKFIIGGGPYLSLFYTGSDKKEKNVIAVSYKNDDNLDLPVGNGPDKYKILSFGVNGLAGFELGRVFLTFNYMRGINDYYEAKDYTGTFRHETMGGTLGVFLGKPIELEKKIKDKDKDGITDNVDHCPEIAGPAITNGCPDKDADGIADKDDQCPDVPGVTAYKGCPVPDTDKDGITDDKDKCPAVFGVARYDGCPVPDSDKDGVNDEEDKCPQVAGLGRYAGCPIPDADGDGVNDEEDKCPQVKGVIEKQGCPEEVKKEIVEKVNMAAKQIQFELGKATLRSSSYEVLDELAILLATHAELNLLIEGHTSTEGPYEVNMKLSQARAETVKSYLLSKGVPAGKVTAQGLGPTKPLNKDKTPAEKTQNRRVELKLSN
jgi:outer membrane protein OmpA-like peptidoglycan-associated protein